MPKQVLYPICVLATIFIGKAIRLAVFAGRIFFIMIKIRIITMQHITLYKQIYPVQCQSLANLGYKSLINLRFDHESEGQPDSQSILAGATSAGLDYHHLPVNGDQINSQTIEQFADLLKHCAKPVMVFCHSGGRAKRLYQSALVSGLL